MMLVQLFNRAGAYIETVSVDSQRPCEVISWKGKYYSLQSGRYIEGDLLFAVHGTSDISPVSSMPASVVQIQVTR